MRRYDNRNILEILGSRADHCRAADIDVFDQFFSSDSWLIGELLEFVQIYDHHLNRRNSVPGKRPHVLGVGTNRENACGDSGMNGFYTAIEHLRKASNF